MNKYKNKLNISGNIIRKNRKQQKMSLDELSNKLQLLGITIYKNDLHRLETNKRAIKDFELVAICRILKIDYQNIDNEVKEN